MVENCSGILQWLSIYHHDLHHLTACLCTNYITLWHRIISKYWGIRGSGVSPSTEILMMPLLKLTTHMRSNTTFCQLYIYNCWWKPRIKFHHCRLQYTYNWKIFNHVTLLHHVFHWLWDNTTKLHQTAKYKYNIIRLSWNARCDRIQYMNAIK